MWNLVNDKIGGKDVARLLHQDAKEDLHPAKVPNNALYKGIAKITNTIRIRRLKLAGHVFRDKSSPAHHTVTWDPRHGQISRGRPTNTFIATLLRDTGLNSTAELEACMDDRHVWCQLQFRSKSTG